MATEAELPVEEGILQLLQHLGIKQGHLVASRPSDWQGLVNCQGVNSCDAATNTQLEDWKGC